MARGHSTKTRGQVDNKDVFIGGADKSECKLTDCRNTVNLTSTMNCY